MNRPLASSVTYRGGLLLETSLRGTRWGEPNRDLDAKIIEWSRHGPGPDCVHYKPGKVWRWRQYVAKLYYEGIRVSFRLRRPAAFRAAQNALRMPPGTSARPIAAVRLRYASSMLICEWIEGQTLTATWKEDSRCLPALAPFMAKLHAARVYHGDLHPGNLLWTGDRFVLLDLESLRHDLRNLNRQQQAIEQWAHLYRRLDRDPRVEAAFQQYCSLTSTRWQVDKAWLKIVSAAN